MEKKINIPPFVVGDKVIYITGINMPKNSKHIVTEVQQKKCGCVAIGINDIPIIKVPTIGNKIVTCDTCWGTYVDDYRNDKNAWRSKSFRKIQESKFKAITFSEIEELQPCEN